MRWMQGVWENFWEDIVAVAAGVAMYFIVGCVADAAAPVVRIRQEQKTCGPVGCQITSGYWSGTVIGRMADERLAVLTCAHGYMPGVGVHIEIVDEQWTLGEIVTLDRQADLGLLACKYDPRTQSIPICSAAPERGAGVISIGYPKGNMKRGQKGVLISGKGGFYKTSAVYIPGESGGAVTTEAGLVGVIVGNEIPNEVADCKLARLLTGAGGVAAAWPQVKRFVETNARLQQTQQAAKPAAPPGPQPYRRGDAPAVADLGDPQPVNPPPLTAPAPVPREAPAEELEWGDVTIVVLIREGALGDAVATAAGLAKRLGKSPRDVIPVGDLESKLAELTKGKAGLRIVTERFSPRAYSEFLLATRIESKPILIVPLVRSADLGVKGLVAGVVEKLLRSRLLVGTDYASAEPIFQRIESAKYDAAVAALSASENAAPAAAPGAATAGQEGGAPPAKTDDQSWWYALLVALGLADGGSSGGLLSKLFGKRKEPVSA